MREPVLQSPRFIQYGLSSVHGVDVIEQQLSGYYVANEISVIYLGMMITIE
jgi:hypothetical protein